MARIGRTERFLIWLSRQLPAKVIEGDKCTNKGPLLVRYYLLHTKYLGIYIHHLMRSDHERAYHDHPWPALFLLLTGGYYEHHPLQECHCHKEPVEFHYIPRWNLRYINSAWQHWLEIPEPVWTLAIRFRRCRHWGFWTDDGFVPWEKYTYTDEDR